jgi:sulfatase modifying factor 1
MTEQDFLDAILSDPKDPTPRLVYADWLDEQGDPRGELIRIQEELRQIAVPHREKIEARMRELLQAGVEPLAITKTNSLRMKFLLIFPGEFLMGSPKSEQGRHPLEHLHAVRISEPFYLSLYQFTERDFFWVHDDNRTEFSVALNPNRRPEPQFLSWYDAVLLCNRLSEMEKSAPNYRLSEVRWADPPYWQPPEPRFIQSTHVEWLHTAGYRLPTEAEWEYACRAGTTTATPYGETLSRTDARFFGSKRKTGPKVGVHPPNGFGLYDMIGNAWEWCWDRLDDNYYRESPRVDPTGPEHGPFRVARGGGRQSNLPSCRSAFRNRLTPSNNTDACLRLVLSYQPNSATETLG